MFVLLISFEKDVTRMCLKRKLKNQFLQIFTLVSHKEPKTRGKYLVNSEFKFAFMFSKRQVDIFERYNNLTYKNIHSCLFMPVILFYFLQRNYKNRKVLKVLLFFEKDVRDNQEFERNCKNQKQKHVVNSEKHSCHFSLREENKGENKSRKREIKGLLVLKKMRDVKKVKCCSTWHELHENVAPYSNNPVYSAEKQGEVKVEPGKFKVCCVWKGCDGQIWKRQLVPTLSPWKKATPFITHVLCEKNKGERKVKTETLSLLFLKRICGYWNIINPWKDFILFKRTISLMLAETMK